MPTSNRLAMLLGLAMLVLFPIIFGSVGLGSLEKLHISPQLAIYIVLAIVVGGLINIPVTRIGRTNSVWSHPLAVFGLDKVIPSWMLNRRQTVIAVNVGGCLIPLAIAAIELAYIVPMGTITLSETAIAVAINTVVCYIVAIAVPGVGIVMPGFVAPLTALVSAVFIAPEAAAPVAFVAGVLGPVVGADLLHMDDFVDTPVAVASIGGAGTFDGIALSAIFAAYLAQIMA